MAFTCAHSTPATGAVALYALATHIITTVAAATKVKDSDGSTYSSSGAQVTSGASGAGGLGNTSAWMILQESGATRQWSFQRGSDNTLWRVKVSPGGFSAGSPGATQTPSATDEQILFGGGTDASPTYAQLFPTDNTYRLELGADASTKAWHLETFPTGGGACRTQLYHDVLVSGTYPSEDTQPVVYRCAYHASTTIVDLTASTYMGQYSGTSFVSNAPVKRVQHGTGSAAWRPVGLAPPLVIGTGTANNIGLEPYGSREAVVALPYIRTGATQPGVHGYSSILWCGTTTTSRSTGDTLQIGSNYYMRVDTGYAPWDSTAVTQ